MLRFYRSRSGSKLAKMPFSIDKAVAGAKREVAADGATQQRAGKVPKVSEMKAEPPRQAARASTSNAPVNIVVYKAGSEHTFTSFPRQLIDLMPQVTDNAGDLWSSYREGGTHKLYQIQVSACQTPIQRK